MKCEPEMMRLYAVTDRTWLGKQSLYEQVEAALKGGVTCVQLREKNLDEADFLAEAMEISALCRQYGVPFLINDNVDIALRCHADGVHVGQEDMQAAKVRQRLGPGRLIGVSAHSVEEAMAAEAAGADYLGVGAMFGTSTKKNVRPLTPEILKAICQAVNIPVVAIGGIHAWNMAQLAGTGANGAALVSAIFGAEDVEAECRRLRHLSEQVFGK